MNKLIKKLRPRKQEAPTRITNETIAEHRERMLAGGRRFKYPLQYARHRLVISAISLGVVALLVFVGVVYWQLYRAENSSDFFYRITRIVPLPVASVDGQPVLYSDYLMKYRSSLHYLQDKEQVSLKTEDGKRQADQVKQAAMSDAIDDAYAIKLAKTKGITVPASELQLFLSQQRSSSDGQVSETTYNAVILDYYGWSVDEYEHATSNKLLRQKVSYAVDTKATATVAAMQNLVSGGNTDLKAIASTLNQDPNTQVTYGTSGLVPKNNQDGGLAQAAAALTKGSLSTVIKPSTGGGYYLIKLIDSNDAQVNYEYVHVELTVFAQQLADLKKDNKKVQDYIVIPTVTATPNATTTKPGV